MWGFCHRPRRQLISLPLTYFEVEDIRPGESQGQARSVPIFVSGELSVPKELNQGILQFFDRKGFVEVHEGVKGR